jgi:HEAT repeat protein
MTDETTKAEPSIEHEKSDLRVVLQYFIVPLALVIVLVLLFFGLQLARHRNADPREALEHLGGDEGFLTSLLGDPKRWQYGYDLSMLMRTEDEADLQRLVPDLTEAFRAAGAAGDLELRRYLTLALGRAADPRAIEPLREAFHDSDPHTRLFAAWGLSRLDDPSGLPELRAAVSDADAGVRKLAVFALGQLADERSVPLLRAALEDPAVDVGWNAALALARLGDPAGLPILIELLESSVAALPGEDEGARERALNAIRGLALIQAPEAMESLRRTAAGAPDPAIREAAQVALSSARGDPPAGLP